MATADVPQTEEKRPEPDTSVLQARDALLENRFPCAISRSGKAVKLQSAATFGKAKELLAKRGLPHVPVYVSQTKDPANHAASIDNGKLVEATPTAKALMQLLKQQSPQIWVQLSSADGNTVLVNSGSYREAAKLRNSRPELASVRILVKVS